MEKTNIEKLLMRCWLGYLGILATMIALMWKVVMRMPKIGHGDRVMLFLESPMLNNDRLKGKYFHDIFIVRAGGEST
jgi:hypothetical protein